MKKSFQPYFVWGLFFIAGSIAGASTHLGRAAIADPAPLRESAKNYSFINPLLACNFSLSKEYRGYESLEKTIAGLIENKKKSGALTQASVFFQDLSTNRWAGVNENIRYSPASLMKVYLMIAHYARADKDPSLLSEKVKFVFDKSINSLQSTAVKNPLVYGEYYPIKDLITTMIVESDNTVVNFLGSQIGDLSFQKVLADLGVTDIDMQTKDVRVSPKEYSLAFRVLHNATYLSKDRSEEALKLLSKVTFKDGLAQGLLSTDTIAHKFGERIGEDSTELHDCGIIYPSDTGSNYVLCVMTKGKNIDDLKTTIRDISKIIREKGVLSR